MKIIIIRYDNINSNNNKNSDNFIINNKPITHKISAELRMLVVKDR